MTKENCCQERDFSSVNLMNSTDCCGSVETACCEPNNIKDESSACCSPKDSDQAACCSSEETSCCKSNNTKDESSACCSPDDSEKDDCCSCDCNSETQENQSKSVKEEFDIEIDGKNVRVTDASMNIVEVAKTAGIAIPAPCFLAKKKNGCCKACVVEIDNKQAYACGTKPSEGMNIIVNREDLKALRKERLLKYKEAIKNNVHLQCGGDKAI